MLSAVEVISVRGVRSLNPHYFRPSWPIFSKAKGWRKRGPVFMEKNKIPGQNHDFPELSPKYKHENSEELRGYTGARETGYKDPETKRFVAVDEMCPELIVPDLRGFKLRPYVSYRTDVEIEKKMRKYEKYLDESSEEIGLTTPAVEKWPPDATTPQLLFNVHYAPTVRKMYKEGRYFES